MGAEDAALRSVQDQAVGLWQHGVCGILLGYHAACRAGMRGRVHRWWQTCMRHMHYDQVFYRAVDKCLGTQSTGRVPTALKIIRSSSKNSHPRIQDLEFTAC